jgi:hypothetical protein
MMTTTTTAATTTTTTTATTPIMSINRDEPIPDPFGRKEWEDDFYDFSKDTGDDEFEETYMKSYLLTQPFEFFIHEKIKEKYEKLTGKKLECQYDSKYDPKLFIGPRTDQVLNYLLMKYRKNRNVSIYCELYDAVDILPQMLPYCSHKEYLSNYDAHLDKLIIDYRKMFYEQVHGEKDWENAMYTFEEFGSGFNMTKCPKETEECLKTYWVYISAAIDRGSDDVEYDLNWCRILQEYIIGTIPDDVKEYLIANEDKTFKFNLIK